MSRPRVLVTGATGFVGGHTVSALVDAGFEVHVLVRSRPESWRIAEAAEGARTHEGDVLRPESLQSCLQRCQPTALVHLAARTVGRGPNDDHLTEELRAVNVEGTRYVLEAASAARTVRAVVRTGSHLEYGRATPPFSETTAEDPRSPYATSMAAATRLAHAFDAGFPIVTLRLALTYGPGGREGSFIHEAFERAVTRRPIVVDDPDALRDPLYVTDAAAAVARCAVRALERKRHPFFERGGVLNVAGAERATLGQIAREIGVLSGLEPALVRRGDGPGRHSFSDASRAREVLGLEPRVSLREGLRRTMESRRCRAETTP